VAGVPLPFLARAVGRVRFYDDGLPYQGSRVRLPRRTLFVVAFSALNPSSQSVKLGEYVEPFSLQGPHFGLYGGQALFERGRNGLLSIHSGLFLGFEPHSGFIHPNPPLRQSFILGLDKGLLPPIGVLTGGLYSAKRGQAAAPLKGAAPLLLRIERETMPKRQALPGQKKKKTASAATEKPFLWFFNGHSLTKAPHSMTNCCYASFLAQTPDMNTYGGAEVVCGCLSCVEKLRVVARVLEPVT